MAPEVLTTQGRDRDTAAGAYVSAGLRHVFASGSTTGVETRWLVSTSDYVENYGQLSLQFGRSF